MNLTKEQFSIFSFATQKKLLYEKGIALFSRRIMPCYEARIYILDGFYAETLVDTRSSEIIHINHSVSGPGVIYFE